MEAFDKLEVWQRSTRLSIDVYRPLVDCKDYGFKDQLFRSCLSIPSNFKAAEISKMLRGLINKLGA